MISAFLRNWYPSRAYTAVVRNESDEDVGSLMKEESGTSILNDGDDESSTVSFQLPTDTLIRRGYSLASVAILFGLGIILGSFIPVSHGTTPLSFVPEIPLREYVFHDSPEFSSQAPDGGNSSWAALIPPRNGMIQIDDPENYGLHPGLPLYSNKNPPNAVRKKYALSVFHQLHCLKMIREEYITHTGMSESHSGHDGQTNADHYMRHLEHCFDYLRQSAMCCADTTVEWASPNAGPTQKPLIDGWDIPHRQCKDWDRVLEFISEHEAPFIVEA